MPCNAWHTSISCCHKGTPVPAGAADAGAPDAAAGEREAAAWARGVAGREAGRAGRAGRGAEGFIKESSDKSARSSVQQLQKRGAASSPVAPEGRYLGPKPQTCANTLAGNWPMAAW